MIRYRLPRVLTLAVALLGLQACAAGTTNSSSTSSSDVITQEDLEELERLTVYQAVQRLRPQWLRARGVDSFEQSNEVVVYIDGTRMGGVGELRRLNATQVAEIRHLDSRQATTQFGSGHPSGAILVLTRRGPG